MSPVNPYIFGHPVDDPEAFFGRQDLLALTRQMFAGPLPTGHLEVSGPKGIGKSSLLHRIRRQIEADRGDAVTVYWTSDQCEPGSQGRFADGLEWTLRQRLRQTVPELAPGGGDASTPWERFEGLLNRVAGAGRRVFLFLDEFHAFVEKLHLGYAQFSWLRGLTQTADARLCLIISSRTPLGEYSHDAISSGLPRIFRVEVIPPLDRKSARDLVTEPAAKVGLCLPPELPERLYDLCHGHPRLTVFCAFEAARRFINGEILDPSSDEFVDLCQRIVAPELESWASPIPEHVHRDIRRLVRRGFPGTYQTLTQISQNPAAFALHRSGFCSFQPDGPFRPLGALCGAYLAARFDGQEQGPAPAEQVDEFRRELEGLEPRFRGYLDHQMRVSKGPDWEADYLPPENFRELKSRAKGRGAVYGTSLGTLLSLARKLPPDGELPRLLDQLEGAKVVPLRNVYTHGKSSSPVTSSDLNKAREAVANLRRYLDRKWSD